MQQKNRILLEKELYIFQRSDIKNASRWYCSFKLTGIKRIYKTLGVVGQEEAAKLARRELTYAEEQLATYGSGAVLGKNTISDAFNYFKNNAQSLISETRYKQVLKDWQNHLYKFFGAKAVIDKRLQKRMAGYVEYRRREVNKKTGERLRAAASTIKLEIVSAKQLLKIARESGGIGSDVGNLSIGINKKKLQQGRSRSTTFTDEEVEKIKDYFDRDAHEIEASITEPGEKASHAARTAKRRLYLLERLRFYVALALATGARVNELRQVRHGDLSDDFKTLRIRKSKTRAGSNRQAYIDNEIWDIKRAYNRYMTYSKTSKKNSLVLAEHEGRVSEQEEKVLTNAGQALSGFLKTHKMLYEKAYGKRRRNFFATRHYFISKQVDDGVDAFQVAQIAGTSVAMIERTYYESDAKTTVKTIEGQKTKTRRASLRAIKGGKK